MNKLGVLPNGVFQIFARAETGDSCGRDFNRLARTGVASVSGLPFGHGKGAKTNECHFLTAFERTGDAIQGGGQGFGGGDIGNGRSGGNTLDQFGFCHGAVLLKIEIPQHAVVVGVNIVENGWKTAVE